MSENEKDAGTKGRTVTAKLHRGIPNVELTEDDKAGVHLELDDSLLKVVQAASAEGPISISLESLDLDLQHNQSYGMIRASTGCISNPGGPGC